MVCKSVDCSKLAMKYGGGHPQASGFIIKTNEISKMTIQNKGHYIPKEEVKK